MDWPSQQSYKDACEKNWGNEFDEVKKCNLTMETGRTLIFKGQSASGSKGHRIHSISLWSSQVGEDACSKGIWSVNEDDAFTD